LAFTANRQRSARQVWRVQSLLPAILLSVRSLYCSRRRIENVGFCDALDRVQILAKGAHISQKPTGLLSSPMLGSRRRLRIQEARVHRGGWASRRDRRAVRPVLVDAHTQDRPTLCRFLLNLLLLPFSCYSDQFSIISRRLASRGSDRCLRALGRTDPSRTDCVRYGISRTVRCPLCVAHQRTG
jgi:hypothetical protein